MHILKELTEEKIKEAILNNFVEYCDVLPEGHFKVYEKDGVKWMSSTFPDPMFNRIVKTKTEGDVLPSLIKEITEQYKSENAPFMWMTWPELDQPANLEEILEDSDFESIGTSSGMALELSGFEEEVPKIPGLEVRKVETAGDFEAYCHVINEGFELTGEGAEGLRVMNEALFNTPSMRMMYLAFLNGKAVATSTVIYCGGVAGIYDVCTLEEARGKGIGKVMTVHPLLEAKSKGYHLAILHSSELGDRLYKRLGFKVYYQIGMYMKK